jgi:hypothetical protein
MALPGMNRVLLADDAGTIKPGQMLHVLIRGGFPTSAKRRFLIRADGDRRDHLNAKGQLALADPWNPFGTEQVVRRPAELVAAASR